MAARTRQTSDLAVLVVVAVLQDCSQLIVDCIWIDIRASTMTYAVVREEIAEVPEVIGDGIVYNYKESATSNESGQICSCWPLSTQVYSPS